MRWCCEKENCTGHLSTGFHFFDRDDRDMSICVRIGGGDAAISLEPPPPKRLNGRTTPNMQEPQYTHRM